MHPKLGIPAALTTTLLLKIATVVPALVLADIIDNLSDSSASAPLLLGAFLCLILLQASLTPLQAWSLAHLCQARVKQLSIRWCRALLDKRFEAYGQLHGGTLVKVLDRGITAQERWLGFLIGSAWPVAVEAAVLMSLFTYLGAGSVLIGLIPLSLGYLWANDRLVRWRRPHIEAVNEREDELAEQWVDTFASAATVKLERAEEAAMQPVRDTLSAYATAATRVAYSAGWLQALRVLFIGSGSCGLLVWGVIDQTSAAPRLSLGELVALFTLVSGLLGSVTQLAEAWRQLDQFRLDKRKLAHWLNLPAFSDGRSAIEMTSTPARELRLDPCQLNMRGVTQLQLDEPLVFLPTERVALVGASGCGKSTLLHALTGTITALRDRLYLGGHSVANCTADWQFEHLRLCQQEARFIPGPLPRSVLLQAVHDRDRVEQWLTQLGLDRGWYELELDARAAAVSGGEARRLTLLRILNRPGAYNFLDEPTSGLDTQTAERTWDLLFHSLEGRGLVCATHDQSNLWRFDRVITLQDGRVVSDQRQVGNLKPGSGDRHSSSSKL